MFLSVILSVIFNRASQIISYSRLVRAEHFIILLFYCIYIYYAVQKKEDNYLCYILKINSFTETKIIDHHFADIVGQKNWTTTDLQCTVEEAVSYFTSLCVVQYRGCLVSREPHRFQRLSSPRPRQPPGLRPLPHYLYQSHSRIFCKNFANLWL